MSKFKDWAEKHKEKLLERLEHDERIGENPHFKADNIRYDVSDRISAVSCGGIGAVHTMIRKIGLDRMIDEKLFLLKFHKPYHESDHVLNIAYNIVCGGQYLEDLELLRNNPAYLNALGAERIPDPTTAGDFTRRFGHDDVCDLMEVMNRASQRVWDANPRNKTDEYAIIDSDGMIKQSYGENKEKLDMSHKGRWGFNPLIITEATSGAHLFVVNRTGSAVSHENAGYWIDRAIEAVRDHFKGVCLRGDGDFSLTEKFDGWDASDVRFCFSYDAHQNLVNKAELLDEKAWSKLPHLSRAVKTKPRRRKKNVKRQVVERREYENMERIQEHVAEFRYQPGNCKKDYRMVVVRRTIRVTRGQLHLHDDVRYFFHVTNFNEAEMSPNDIVRFNHGRCNHENKLEQLKNGVCALKMPAAEFIANWAYMATCTIAWNIKSWMGQLMPDAELGDRVIRMEFKRFKNCLINIPCQIIQGGRSITYRILNYTPWIETFWETFHHIKELRFAHV